MTFHNKTRNGNSNIYIISNIGLGCFDVLKIKCYNILMRPTAIKNCFVSNERLRRSV